MKTLNHVFLLGSVGKDPELRSTGGGTLVANLSLATDHRYKDTSGNWQDETTWHNLTAFARTAEVIRDYVKKGDPLHVEGRIKTETWEKDGRKNYKTVIIVENLILLGGKEKTVSNTNPAPSASQIFGNDVSEEDIPF